MGRPADQNSDHSLNFNNSPDYENGFQMHKRKARHHKKKVHHVGLLPKIPTSKNLNNVGREF